MNNAQSKLVLELRAENAKFISDLAAANSKLDKFGQTAEAQTQRAARGMKALDAASSKANHAIGNSANQMNAFGVQFQDVVVQAQMGTSWFTIIAQQGSQLAGVFGPTGALIGGVVALSAALGGMLWRSMSAASEAADEAREAFEKLVPQTPLAQLAALNAQIEAGKESIKELQATIRSADVKFELAPSSTISGSIEAVTKLQTAALAEKAEAVKRLGYEEQTLKKLIEDRTDAEAKAAGGKTLDEQRKYYSELWQTEKEGQEFINDLIKEVQDDRLKDEKDAAAERLKVLKQAEQDRQKLIQQVEQIRGSGLSDTAKENELNANNIAILDNYRKQGLDVHGRYNAMIESETVRHNAAIYQINNEGVRERARAEQDAAEMLSDMIKDALKGHEDYVKERERILQEYDPASQEMARHRALIDSINSSHNERLMSDANANAMLEQESVRHQKVMSEIRQQGLIDQGLAWDALMEQYKQNAENWAGQVESIRAAMVEGLVNGVADALAQAVVQGKSLADTLEQVGKAVITEVVSSFIKLGIQMLINKAMGSAIQAAAVAEAAVAGPAIAALYAPAAAMTSLASFGANSIPAMSGIGSTVALANSLAITGMAHDGIASVPREGTWLLDKGERVLSADHNERIVKAMEGEGSAASGVTVNNVFNISPGIEGTVRAEIIRAVPALERMAVTAVESAIRSGGSISRAAGRRR